MFYLRKSIFSSLNFDSRKKSLKILMDRTSDDDLLSEDGESSISTDSYAEEIEFDQLTNPKHASGSDSEGLPYSEKPLADDEWLEEYNREKKRIEEREQGLQNRLERVVAHSNW